MAAAPPLALECPMVAAGLHDPLRSWVADMAAYRRFPGATLLRLPGKRETRTYAAMEEEKDETALPL